MKPSKGIAVGLDPATPRRSWTSPGVRRLATSAAEANVTSAPDAFEGLS